MGGRPGFLGSRRSFRRTADLPSLQEPHRGQVVRLIRRDGEGMVVRAEGDLRDRYLNMQGHDFDAEGAVPDFGEPRFLADG